MFQNLFNRPIKVDIHIDLENRSNRFDSPVFGLSFHVSDFPISPSTIEKLNQIKPASILLHLDAEIEAQHVKIIHEIMEKTGCKLLLALHHESSDNADQIIRSSLHQLLENELEIEQILFPTKEETETTQYNSLIDEVCEKYSGLSKDIFSQTNAIQWKPLKQEPDSLGKKTALAFVSSLPIVFENSILPEINENSSLQWNLFDPSTAQDAPTLRDALYAGSMLNCFLRNKDKLGYIHFEHIFGVNGLINYVEDQEILTGFYYVFEMFSQYQNHVVPAAVLGKFFDSPEVEDFPALRDIPYMDALATVNDDASVLSACLINRHPDKRAFVNITLDNFEKMKLQKGFLMRHDQVDAANTAENPMTIKSHNVGMPQKSGSLFRFDLPPLSISIMLFTKFD